MKRLTIIFVIIGGIIIIGLTITIIVLSGQSQEADQASQVNTENYINPEDSNQIKVLDKQGNIIVTKDFYSNPIEIIGINGILFAVGSNYNIAFYPENSEFIISLLDEDLNTARTEAELDLKEKLGLSESEICDLRVTVNTTVYVDETAAGRNLGLSFCPSHVAL